MKQKLNNAQLISKVEAAEKRIVELERDLSQKNRILSRYEQAEEAPHEAELRYRALFEQSHDAIFIVNLAGHHLAVNQRAVDMLGYSRQELLALSVNDLSADSA